MADVTISTFSYEDGDYENWELPFDYHCLYILENGKDAYIGETKAVVRRSQEHKAITDVCSRYKFRRIHVVTGQTFDETPAKHYETLLIRLMKADGKFRVRNKKEEWQHYGRKNEFELCFDRLWLELEKKGLVRHKEFQDVLNLSAYKFSPDVPLTQAQCEALTSILHTIDSRETMPHAEGFRPRPICVSGDAGTGKTVVATSLFHYLRTHEPYKSWKIGLVYPTSPTRAEIQNAFKAIPDLRKKDVLSPSAIAREHYNIVICDEAQRLRRPKDAGRYYTGWIRSVNRRLGLPEDSDELDWLLTNSDCLILFYDRKQSVSSADIPAERFEERLLARDRGVRPIALKEQMRLRAGEDYAPYVYDVLYERSPRPRQFEGYELKIFRSFADMFRLLREKEEAYGFSRLCGGYAWKRVSKNHPEQADIRLDGVDVFWNQRTAGWLSDPSAREEMGSIYTLPGLDLNYAFVVIGPELTYENGGIRARREALYDNQIKRTGTDEELKTFLLNIYGVFMTRGILGTCLYVCDDALRDYLGRFFPMV